MSFGTDLALAGLVTLFTDKGRANAAAPGAPGGALKGLPFALAPDPQERSNDNQRTGIGRYDFRLRAGEVATIALVGDFLHLDANYSCGSLRVQLDPSGSLSSLGSIILAPGQTIKGPFSGISIAPVGAAAGRLLLGSGVALVGESKRAQYYGSSDPFGGGANVIIAPTILSAAAGAPPVLANFGTEAGTLAFGWKNLTMTFSGWAAGGFPLMIPSVQFGVSGDPSAGVSLTTGELVNRCRFLNGAEYWQSDTYRFPDGCVRSDSLSGTANGRILLAMNGATINANSIAAEFDLYQFK